MGEERRDMPAGKTMLWIEVRNRLAALAEEKYLQFTSSLSGDASLLAFGVRVPLVRELAKELLQGAQAEVYGEQLNEAAKTTPLYREERMLYGMLLGKIRCTEEERIRRLREFVPLLNSWETCDVSVASHHFYQKNPQCYVPMLQEFLNSSRTFCVRYAIVVRMTYYLADPCVEETLRILAQSYPQTYYIDMAIAWALSTAYVKYPQKTWELLQSGSIAPRIVKKAVQKCCDSFRISVGEKRRLRAFLQGRQTTD